MSDQELLDELRREVKEQADELALDPRWQALLDGSISDEDRAALHRLAEESPQARTKLDLFTPIGGEARGRMIELAALRMTRPKKPRFAARAITGAFVAALTATASFLFFVHARPEPLPSYEAEVRGGRIETRGAEHERIPVFQRGMNIEVILRPEHEVDGAIDVRAFVLTPEGARAWQLRPEIAKSGSIHIETRVDDLNLGPGTATLLFLVGRAEEIEAAAGNPDAAVETERVHLMRSMVRIEE